MRLGGGGMNGMETGWERDENGMYGCVLRNLRKNNFLGFSEEEK